MAAGPASETREQWANRLRLLLSPKDSINADGSVKQEFYKPKKIVFVVDKKWGEAEKLKLYEASPPTRAPPLPRGCAAPLTRRPGSGEVRSGRVEGDAGRAAARGALPPSPTAVCGVPRLRPHLCPPFLVGRDCAAHQVLEAAGQPVAGALYEPEVHESCGGCGTEGKPRAGPQAGMLEVWRVGGERRGGREEAL
jgi:hypothetical protein